MSAYSKNFVRLIFTVLALSFWATTAMLYLEYADQAGPPKFEGELWFDMMTHFSHKFLFFPLFGTIALFAFFLPAAVFVDMYWRPADRPENEIPYAKLRFSLGFVVAIALAALGSLALSFGDETALWQLSREKVQEKGGPNPACAILGRDNKCLRVTFPTALANVRHVSQERERLNDLKRTCDTDPLIEKPKTPERKRFCFVTAKYSRIPEELENKLLTDKQCCDAIARFEADVRNLHQASPANRSILDRTEYLTLAPKIFFLIVIFIISVLLAFRRKRIMAQYGHLAHRIDRGVLIGAAAMLFFPVMNHAFLLATELIYGPNQPLIDSTGVSFYRVPYGMSVIFGIWAFFIMLFFIRREDKESERMSKIIGTVLSGVFVLKYDTIVDYAVRFAGPGAGNQSVLGLINIAVLMWLALVLLKAFRSGDRRPS